MAPRSGTDLTVGSIPRHIVTFSLPMLIGSFLQTAYSFVNAIWVGKFLGRGALAAVTVSFPIVFILFAVGMGMSLATNILVSQSYGAKRFDELRRVVDSSNLIIPGLGVVLTILGEIFTPHILRAMDTPPAILDASVHYLRIFLLSLPFSFCIFALRSMLQGMGDSKTPLYFQFASVVLTTVLDPLLIFGKLGLPALGLNGTAWATNFSQALLLVALVVYLRRQDSPVAPAWPRLRHLGEETRRTFRIGIPSSIQQSLVSLGLLALTGLVNGFGEISTAAYGAASRIDQIAFLPAVTFGMAISTLAGQNLGAGHMDRVREIFKWGCLMSGAITVVISAVAVLFPETILRVFTSDEAVLAQGVSYLHIVGSCYVFFALTFVSNGIINGSGATLVTTILSLISLWVIRVPVAYGLSRSMHDVKGIWYGIALSFILMLVCSMGYYFSGHWKRSLDKRGKGGPPGAEATARPDPAKVFAHDTGEA